MVSPGLCIDVLIDATDSNSDWSLDLDEFSNAFYYTLNFLSFMIYPGLCIDALIDATDSNSDWGLDLDEFSNALDPNFLLPRKRCALEERQFEDGAETKVDCNRSVL